MLFNSFTFAAFLVIVYALYALTQRRLRLQNALLLTASYVFYAWWDWRFLALIVASTIVDFLCGWALDRRHDATNGDAPTESPVPAGAGRKRWLFVSLAANLGILAFFKYYDFFAGSAADLLTAIGLPLEPRLLELALPVGISFYTFQTMSYTIDIYRGRLRAHRNLLDFAVFVSFFPQLVAGPIMRAAELLPQVAHPRRLSARQTHEGAYLLLWGLFKKVVVADNLALLVDRVYGAPETPVGGLVLVATYAFAFQIYCDFSGYSDMARGCAKLLGFELRINFHLPLFATNPRDFWRRWHITLSEWFRDYVYIPLGGDRRGARRAAINAVLTMLLAGLWHGAAWNFVWWGAYHGLLLVAYRLVKPRMNEFLVDRTDRFKRLWRFAALVGFFHLSGLGWLLFRADSMQQVGSMLASLATPWPWWLLVGANTLAGTGLFYFLAYALPLLLVQIRQWRTRDLDALLRISAPFRGLVYAVMFYALVLFSDGPDKPFIYFQF